MRRRSIPWLSALALSALLAAAVPATAGALPGPTKNKRVRAFVMGAKLNMRWLESRETYRDYLFALADKKLRGPGKPIIQRGADDFASHLRGPATKSDPVNTARDLVVWPESIGLFAALTGQRAAPARNSGTLEGSIGTLIGLYAPQNAYYGEKYPHLNGRGVPTRLLALALTDTFGRTVLEPMAEMADKYDAYLEVSVDMAQTWQVVCRSKATFKPLPGGVKCNEENADKVQRLGDPFEPDRDYVYEATTDKPSIMSLVYAPDGKLVGKIPKSYITPLELGQDEEEIALDMVPGAVSDADARPLKTPVGTLGFVISKAAWMPDVVQKLDQQHVDVFVQPEFFVGNMVTPSQEDRNSSYPQTTMWNPEVLWASGYNNVLRHPSLESLALPQMVGGVFNFYADHQSHIAVKPRSARRQEFMAGMRGSPGMVNVMPFAIKDPLSSSESIGARRERLAAEAAKMNSGSAECPDPAEPGACKDGHYEGVIWRDLTVNRSKSRRSYRGRFAATPFSRAKPVAPSKNAQRNAVIARRGKLVLIAFEERRADRDQILLVRSENGGRTWSKPFKPLRRPAGRTDEWWPALVIGQKRRVTIAWTDRATGRERVYFSRSTNGGKSFGTVKPLDLTPKGTDAQWKPALAAGARDVVHAVWVDERTRMRDNLPQSGVYYTRIVKGESEAGAKEPARRLDTGTPARLAMKMDNSWAPTITASGNRVLIGWLDFLHYDWDVFSRLSTDGGNNFGDQRAVNDTVEDDPSTLFNEQVEALNDTPSALLLRGSPLFAWTDWRKQRDPFTEHRGYDTYLSPPGGKNRQVDPYGTRQASTFSPSACVSGLDVLVAFQDNARGPADVRIVRMRGGTARGRAHRVDDAGATAVNSWRPKLSCTSKSVTALWEDERNGPPQTYIAVARASALR